jgi:AraC-like DNA-binding protein
MINRIYGIVYKIPVKADEKITMDHCFTYLKCNTNTMSVTASTLFALLLLKWNEYIGIAGNNTDNNHSDQVFKILVTGIIYDMKKNYSIKSLADSLNMCERNFRQKFIKSIGIPPKRYIETQRLDSAAELLISTSLLVKEISKMAGYEDEHYFSRIFKKNYGITPKKYRINSAIE